MVLSGWRTWLRWLSEPSRRPGKHRRTRQFRPQIDPLEDRCLLSTYVVNSIGDEPDGNYGLYNDHVADTGHTPQFDSGGNLIGFTPYTGVCTLRAAIQQANADGVPAVIDFAIPGAGVHTIATGGLPAITVPIVIDGTTQPGYDPSHPTPLIELTGITGGPGRAPTGLSIGGDKSTVRGLVINGFGIGIFLASGSNHVEGNYIGTDATGTSATANDAGGNPIPLGNAEGVVVSGADNTIGGTTAAARNIISGNLVPSSTFGNGVHILGGPGNLVEGNYIGPDVTGKFALPNGIGVCINGFANTVGGAADAAFNLISGNLVAGILIDTTGTGNKVQGNLIGTDVGEAAKLPNGVGVKVTGPDNLIGGSADLVKGDLAGVGNLISGNSGDGVLVAGAAAKGNKVEGNFIGTNGTGRRALGNGGNGVEVNGAAAAQVGAASSSSLSSSLADGPLVDTGNLISGNGKDGVLITGHDATDNRVQANFIGTDLTGGTATGSDGKPLGNTGNGVEIDGGTALNDEPNNLIGGSSDWVSGHLDGEGNLISGNMKDGILITGQNAPPGGTGVTSGKENKVQGNYIGTDASGTKALPGTDATGNPIQGNVGNGVEINAAPANQIGDTLLVAGDKSLIGAGNLISGNQQDGVLITGQDASFNQVQGNYIGTDVTGGNVADAAGKPLGNVGNGVKINGAPQNRIGGTSALAGIGGTSTLAGQRLLGPGNLISGNQQDGLLITGQEATANTVQSNFIGSDATGTKLVIVTDASGTPRRGNAGNGVEINDAPENTIGGPILYKSGNVISGNQQDGVLLRGQHTTGNKVLGNLIGPDLSGTRVLTGTDAAGNPLTDAYGNPLRGNAGNGVDLVGGSDNTVGGETTFEPSYLTGKGNLISGNEQNGVVIAQATATMNKVQGNFIGTDITGTKGLGNYLDGVFVNGAPTNTIGGPASFDGIEIHRQGNLISGNTQHGVLISGSTATGDTVQGNFIGTDATGAKALPGTDAKGKPTQGNVGNGVFLIDASGNWIGGAFTLGNYSFNPLANQVYLKGEGNLISGNQQNGVLLRGGQATGNTVQGNLIGTDQTGTQPLGNLVDGVRIDGAAKNVLGGAPLAGDTTPGGTDNLISGNQQDGVRILGQDATGNKVQGNEIGTDVTGTKGVGNTGNGVEIKGAPANLVGGSSSFGTVLTGDGNLISGNQQNGALITGQSATGNKVWGNFLGTDLTGATATGTDGKPLGNVLDGVRIDGAAKNRIGEVPSLGDRKNPDGDGQFAGNLISGNQQNGVRITGQDANDNTVQGNFIGTDLTGTSATDEQGQPLGNVVDGVLIEDAPGNTIGGASKLVLGYLGGEGNLISGNRQYGLVIMGQDAAGNTVQGDFLGTDVTGTQGADEDGTPLGNAKDGVRIDAAPDNTIGSAGVGNIIAFNGGIGVAVVNAAATGTTISANAIDHNHGPGIDLGADGPTPPTPGSPHVGPNNLQNVPLLTALTAAAGKPGFVTLDGMLNSTPGHMFLIEFFANTAVDAVGTAEGELYLGSIPVMTDALGNVAFTSPLLPGSTNVLFTATATDLTTGDTSEFSPFVTVAAGGTVLPPGDPSPPWLPPPIFGAPPPGAGHPKGHRGQGHPPGRHRGLGRGRRGRRHGDKGHPHR